MKDVVYFLILIYQTVTILCVEYAEEGNLIRNGPAFQSTTWDGHWAYRGNDYPIHIGYVGQKYYCTHTSHDARYGWWMADLKKSYNINRICLLNREVFPERLINFNITVKKNLYDQHENICKATQTTSVKIANTVNDYECFNCLSNSIGSFLKINQVNNAILTLCDVKVYGEFVEERDYEVINSSNFKSFHKDFIITDLINTECLTAFQQISESDLFIRINFQNQVDVLGVFILASEKKDVPATFQNIYISISDSPQTIFNPKANFLVKDYNSSFNGNHATHTFFTNSSITGSYLLINSYDKTGLRNVYMLDICSLTIYGHSNRSAKENIKHKVEAITKGSNDIKAILTDDIYYFQGITNYVSLLPSEMIKIEFSSVSVKLACITVLNMTSTSVINIELSKSAIIVNTTTIEVENTILISHTLCTEYLNTVATSIVLDSNEIERLTEVDIISNRK
ncbi:DgyrCDS14649 [Dimorphilus gyrociliatus]|uniref:DgyrCDS14649 n=1 Tax=Dimorphilus gyrociliatus TaxID=2664684 RepID=A0A7I8WED7_9ANNE|nr:DgyrCDS14649 [Dimorphilus gyrociliatus]